MLIEKLTVGVLRVLTPMGPRFIRPELSQRLYLLWIFRHFNLLPLQVLSVRQQRMIDALCADRRFVPVPEGNDSEDAPILGTVEWRSRPEKEVLPTRRPSTAVPAAVARATAGSHQH